MSITQLVRGVLPLDRTGSDEMQRGTTEPTTQEPRRPSTKLFRCNPCNATYISEAMDSCPECDGSVEVVPSERDLGYV